MTDLNKTEGLLTGAYDMHVHSGPDVLPRKFDDLELAKRAEEKGMAGFVLKSHYVCTADRATLIRKLFPKLKAFGGIALNNSVGGLNPIAVDIAGRLGAKVVWLPTVDSANELQNVAGQRDETKLPYWMSIAREMRAMGIAGPWRPAPRYWLPTWASPRILTWMKVYSSSRKRSSRPASRRRMSSKWSAATPHSY